MQLWSRATAVPVVKTDAAMPVIHPIAQGIDPA